MKGYELFSLLPLLKIQFIKETEVETRSPAGPNIILYFKN